MKPGVNSQTADDLSAQAGRVSAFNKGLSGGGYGPLVAGGQMAIGIKSKNAVGITDLAEAPICLSGFLVWCWLQGFPQLDLAFAMCIGAGLAPAFGATAGRNICEHVKTPNKSSSARVR